MIFVFLDLNFLGPMSDNGRKLLMFLPFLGHVFSGAFLLVIKFFSLHDFVKYLLDFKAIGLHQFSNLASSIFVGPIHLYTVWRLFCATNCNVWLHWRCHNKSGKNNYDVYPLWSRNGCFSFS